MNYKKTIVPYTDTHSFSKIVIDYIANDSKLQPLFGNSPTWENIEKQIDIKKQQQINRKSLIEAIEDSYREIAATQAVTTNISLLGNENTFTICTAHQPNIFTGHLYFIYKILHAVKLAQLCKEKYPAYNFVPVYYMGSEDADLDELGHINVGNETFTWQTEQKGAVGRMLIDKAFIGLVNRLAQEFIVMPNGAYIIEAVKNCYTIDKTIQQATLAFVNTIMGQYGVVVLIADHKLLKQQMIPVFEKEILNNESHNAVANNSSILSVHYKEQAHSRAINLFYLKNDIRERIELVGENYQVNNTDIIFSREALMAEIKNNPENFSPNVILRGLFQETIMQNIAFIGGGGELAYWLQLKNVFEINEVPFPILVLRNSFLLLTEKQNKQWQQLGFENVDLFKKTADLETTYTKRNTDNDLSLADFSKQLGRLYNELKQQATSIDSTLTAHIAALEAKQLMKIEAVEKKFIRAEKRNFDDRLKHIRQIKNVISPNENLQERHDNIIPYLAQYGPQLLDAILETSLTVEQQFVILTVD